MTIRLFKVPNTEENLDYGDEVIYSGEIEKHEDEFVLDEKYSFKEG
jgi:hypothetical protein